MEFDDRIARILFRIRASEKITEDEETFFVKGTIIEDALLPATQKKDISLDLRMKTIHENERDYIITVLKKYNGRILGAGGAAEILNIPPTH